MSNALNTIFGLLNSDRNWTTWRAAVLLASATMFIACLAQTAFVTDCCYVVGERRSEYGLGLLVIGWAGVLGSEYHPLLFVLIVAGWLCACARWYVAASICALSSIAVIASFHEQVLPNAGYAAWLANPIVVAAWFFYRGNRRSAAMISAILASGLMLTFLGITTVPLSDKFGEVEIISYGSGYWLWIASAGILVAGASNLSLRSSAPDSW